MKKKISNLFPSKVYLSFMKVILLFFALLINDLAFTQLQIVRDPIACAYGLKNADKKWVVPAQYQEIQLQQSGFFTFKEGDKWGVLTRMGKVFVGAKYDQINMLTADRFVLVNKKVENSYTQNLMGIMDTSKVWVLPQEFSSIQQLNKGRFLVVKTTYSKTGLPKHQSTILEGNGAPLLPYFDGVMIYKFNEQSVFVVGDNLAESSTVIGNVRFFSSEGKQLSDSTFDKVTPCGENYTVLKNNKYGLFSAEGKPIVWPKYTFEKTLYNYSNALPCLHTHHQFVFIENGKKGILNGDWKVHLAPIYEKLITIYAQVQTVTSARYFGYISETNSYDLIDVNGKKLAEADTFMTKNIRIPKTEYYASDAYRVCFFFGKRQDKGFNWGIMDEKGVVLIPATNATIIVTNDLEGLMVESGNNGVPQVNRVLLTEKITTGIKTQPVTFKAQLDSIYLFEFEQHYYPLIYDQTQKMWRQEMYGYNLPKSFGNLVLISGNSGGFIYNKSTNLATKVKSISFYSGGLPTVQTADGINLIHPRLGFLFKENYTQINQQFASKNRIWVFTNEGKWRIYDTLGVQRVVSEFDAIAYDWESMIVQQNYKKGLLDENCKWVIQPVFSDLFQFTKNFYVGITSTSKVAVIKLANPTIIDTSYSSFIPLYYSGDGNVVYYSLEKNGKTTCYDKDGKLVSQSKKEILMNHWTEESSYNFFYIQCAEYAQKSILQNHKELVYNYFYPTYWNQMQRNKSAVINGIRGTSYGENKQFKAEFVTLNTISLSITEPPTVQLDEAKYSGGSTGYLEVSNWVLQSGGTYKKVAFTDLFNTNSPVYQKIIVEAIQDNPNIRIDCNHPDFLFSGAQQFSFHKNGIKLFFFEGQSQAFELILTKTQLSKIPSAKWILGYL
jgi:hypothetical protein